MANAAAAADQRDSEAVEQGRDFPQEERVADDHRAGEVADQAAGRRRESQNPEGREYR